jgi:hypothetical protein
LLLGIDHRHVASRRCVRQIEAVSGQPFIKEPDSAGIAARGLLAHERFDGVGTGGNEQALEDSKIEALIFEGEGEVAFEGGMRGVARRHDAPAFLLYEAVVLSDGRECPGQRNGEVVSIYQRSIAGWRRRLGEAPFLKNRHGS